MKIIFIGFNCMLITAMKISSSGRQCLMEKIETEKGYFLELCEIAANDKEHPYVLILDEINRVDLARLFGEAFSCIENRNESIDLPYKIDGVKLKLTVPDNLLYYWNDERNRFFAGTIGFRT